MSTSSFERNTTFVQAVLLTTLLAGSLDALSAIIQFTLSGNHQPARIFRQIAGGIFDRPAPSGGCPSYCSPNDGYAVSRPRQAPGIL
ncbi:hypothetical protein ACQ86N_05345 [Puia sp. P3]|uniref:hypothetical protein n=1 Tax=Puia sp. P3 TaxID=3423952 RepID=UPI003D66A591